MTPALILPFANAEPIFVGPLAFAEPRSAVIGRATIGAGAWLSEDSVVRADGEVVRIGTSVYLGHRATVHIVHELLPAIIGDNVTIGANSVVHACTVGDNCVIENDVTVLDDAKVAANVLIEAGSTVFPRKVLDSGWIYAGSPAKPVRELKAGELAARAEVVRGRRGSEREMSPAVQESGNDVFVARTAQRAGRVSLSPGSSLFFSCVADAGTGSISVGENTNIQDNTTIRVGAGNTTVGHDVTVGHNVAMGAVRVGNHTLIGMGAHLADGVWVQDDVLLAAGATTEAGQVLETGWLWGGRPAKALSRLDESRRAGMAENVRQYCEYARTFSHLQKAHAAT